MTAVLSQAFRSWKSARAIALLATLAFAVGIGSTTAIYTVVDAVMLAPLPYGSGDRFVALYGARFSEPGQFSSSTFRDLQEYQRRTTSFDVFGWFRLGEANLTAPGEPRHVRTTSVTTSLAQHLGASPLVGQWFAGETGAVLSNRLWRQLGSDPSIVGRAMTLDGHALTVTGVMPPAFRLPVSGPGGEGFDTDVWLFLDPTGKGANPDAFYYFCYARRKPGVTLEQAEADVKRVAAEIAALDPPSHPSYTARLLDLREGLVREIRPTLLLLFLAAGLLLLITCANVAGLLLTRSVARARETATRVALGISQWQLAIQYFAEGLLVSIAGAAAGIVASIGLVRAAISLGGDFIPRADEVALDWTVVAFAAGMAILTSILCSVAPLWQAARTAPIDVLSAGVRASASARVRRLSQSLVVGEIALAFTLLAVSGALVLNLRGLARTSPGFEPDHLLTFSVTIPDTTATDDATRQASQKRLVDAVKAIPGVVDAGISNRLPLTGCCLSATIFREGHPVEAKAIERTSYMIVDPGYFRATRIPLRRGRFLTEGDTSEDPLHVVLNQSAATRYWGSEDPVGEFGRFGGADGTRFQVEGVIGDVRNNGLGRATVPEIYLLNAVSSFNPVQFVVRSPLRADTLLAEVRRAIRAVDPTLPVHDAQTMDDIVRDSLSLERVGSLMTTFFALAALLMATLGVYGLVSYGVRQRTVEIGTRMALGAVGRDVLALVIGSGLKMAGAGVLVGAVAVVAAVSLLARFFELHDVGWLAFAGSTLTVALVATAASSFPAWRATRLSPIAAIRDESQSVWASARSGIGRALQGLSEAMTAAPESTVISESALLAEFVASARRAESPADQVQLALTTLQSSLEAEWASLFEKTAAGYRCTVSARAVPASDDAPADVEPAALPADGFLVSRVAVNRTPLVLTAGDLETLTRWAEEVRPDRRAEVDRLKTLGVRLAAALRTKHEILGLLLVGPPNGRSEDGRAEDRRTAHGRAEYGSAEAAVLTACAAQFALMIENGRLTRRIVEQEKLRRDLALAAEVQKRLLPEGPPATSLAALAAVSLPARTVGGDYFDFIDAGDQRIGIALADVAGKGVAAALIMSSVQASLRILSADASLSLPQLAAKMNRFLHESTGAKSYATFFYAQLEQGSRRLRYVNAGHLPPYLLRSAASIEELTTGGAVIGLFPQMAYDEGTADLEPGDVLVAFTDGVTEAMNASEEEFGEERLKELLRQVVHLPVDEISARISEALKQWIQDAAQYDDVTFVVMKVS